MPPVRFLAVALVALAAFPAPAASRTFETAPQTSYSISADAFVRPDATDVLVRVANTAGPVPDQLEKVQIKVWPRDNGAVDVHNVNDVPVVNGVATVSVPRLALMQRVEVDAHVKDGSQNVLRDETLVQYGQLGAVSTDHGLATAAGEKILRDGGNAFDAAAAVLFALNVVQPSLAGIGGGSEVVVRVAREDRVYAIVGRERAPANTQATMYDGQTRDRVGFNGYSVGVPGTLRTVEAMLERWGTKSLAEVLDPAIALAEQGHPVGWYLAKDSALGRTAALQPEAVAAYRRPNGTPLQIGDLLVQPQLASTFHLIAREGSRVFYRGEIAQAIVDAQQKLGVGSNAIANGAGRMTLPDLAAYDVEIREASHLDYKGYDVYSAPPPSSGGQVLLETLGLLEQRFPIGETPEYAFGRRHTIHAMVESLRLAFADRDRWIGDPTALPVPETQLLSEAYLRDRAALLSPFPDRQTPLAAPPAGNPWAYPGTAEPVELPESDDSHTTHFSIVDAYGNAVSFTTTLRDSFGSGIMVGDYGFVLNNSLALFNIPARVAPDPGANNAGENRRPMGSQTPTLIVRDGTPIAATGTWGSAFIPSLVLNVVLDVIDHELSLQRAVDSSRIWSQFSTGQYAWAPGFRDGLSISLDEIIALRALGPPRPMLVPAAGELIFGSLATVGIEPATLALQAASDDRRMPDASAVVLQR